MIAYMLVTALTKINDCVGILVPPKTIHFCGLIAPQTVNSWTYQDSRAPNAAKFSEIMEQNLRPTKTPAYEAQMSLDRKRWTHHAGRKDPTIADQTTSNPVEQNMSMIGSNVSVIFVFWLAGASSGRLGDSLTTPNRSPYTRQISRPS